MIDIVAVGNKYNDDDDIIYAYVIMCSYTYLLVYLLTQLAWEV